MASDPFVAVDAAIAQGDLDQAADLVEHIAERFVAGAEPRPLTLSQLEALLNKLAAVAHGRPWLLYYAAWVASSLRQQRLAWLTLERAARAFQATPSAANRERGLILVRLAQAMVAQRDGRVDDARAAFADARALVHSDRRLPDSVHAEDAARWRQNDPGGAATFWLDAAATFEATGEPLPLARALHNLSHFALARGEPSAARRLAREACELKQTAGLPHSYANSRNALGMAERVLGYLDAARDDLEEARAIGERSGHRMISAYALCNLAEVATDEGHAEEADELFNVSSAEKLALGDDYALAYGWRGWARAKRLQGDAPGALELAQRAWQLRRHTNESAERAELLAELGGALVACGDAEQARAMLSESEALALAVDSKQTLAAARLHLARATSDRALAVAAWDLIQRQELRCLEVDARPVLEMLGVAKQARPAVTSACGMRAYLLGGFRLLVGPVEVHSDRWRSRRAAELLRLLVLHHQRPVQADQVLEWLWPETGPDARRSLNSAISLIRRALEEAGGQRDWLRNAKDCYQLGPFTWVDLDALRETVARAERAEGGGRLDLARGRYTEALRLWERGELLPQDRYAAWAEPPQARLADVVRGVRERLIELCLELGMVAEAVRQAEAAVRQDPAAENAYRLLIRSHLARDDHSAALTALHRCEASLAQYDGSRPSAGLVALLGSA